jgi:anti-sigma factor (TIGR02949 family)
MADEPSALNCQEIIDLLVDYLDGGLPADTAKALETHLEGCPPCIAFVNTYRGTVDAARRIREFEIPPELHDRLLSFLKHRRS